MRIALLTISIDFIFGLVPNQEAPMMERVILAPGSEDDEDEDDLYKGYNEFHPVLDSRVSCLHLLICIRT